MFLPLPRIASLVFLSLLCFTGCAGPQPLPVSETRTATPGTFPLDANEGASLTPPPATATMEILPTAILPTVRIKNAETGAYLYEKDGQAQLGDVPASEAASLWGVEDYQGGKRLQNRASGNYLSIENLKEYVEIIPIKPDWMSPRWVFEGDPAQGSIVIRNLWHNWQVLYAKDGQVRYERAPTDVDNARWILESVDGAALAASTPTPVVVIPVPPNPPDSRGAIVPWVEYQAEAGKTNAEILAPDRAFGTIASESTGRSAVKLVRTGDYVEFTAQKQANSTVVRFVIPDSEEGTGFPQPFQWRRSVRLRLPVFVKNHKPHLRYSLLRRCAILYHH